MEASPGGVIQITFLMTGDIQTFVYFIDLDLSKEEGEGDPNNKVEGPEAVGHDEPAVQGDSDSKMKMKISRRYHPFMRCPFY